MGRLMARMHAPTGCAERPVGVHPLEDPMHHASRRAVVGAVLTSLLILALAGASSAQVASLETPGPEASPVPDAGTVGAGNATSDDFQEAMLAFTQCMRDHGIEMDDPQFMEGGGAIAVRIGGEDGPRFDPQSEEFQAAQEACGSILEAARPQLDPAVQAELIEGQLAMAQCLRDHGIEGFPDPAMDADGRLQRIGGAGVDELPFDPFSDAFRDANEACAEELGIEGGPGFGAIPAERTP
jgi:hypothetical protein